LVVIHEPVLEISCGQKQCAQTDTRRWSQDLAAYGAQVITCNWDSKRQIQLQLFG